MSERPPKHGCRGHEASLSTRGTRANTLSLAFFGQGGTQIGSTQVVTMGTTNANTFVGFNSAVPVKSATLSGFCFVGNDLRANVFPTPEPSAFAALCLGAAAVLRRRRK